MGGEIFGEQFRERLMAICHDARKGRRNGSHWSKPLRLPLLDQFDLRFNAAGQVVNETGTVFSVIHQYDRIPD